MADIRISLRNTKGQSRKWWMIHSQDSLHSIYKQDFSRFLTFHIDLTLGFVNTFIWFLAVTVVMHEADHAYSMRSTRSCGPVSHNSTQYMDFVETFIIVLDLYTIYFTHFSGCWASFVYSCHSILECYNLFFWSQVECKIFSYFMTSSVSAISLLFLKQNKHCKSFNYKVWIANLKLQSFFFI